MAQILLLDTIEGEGFMISLLIVVLIDSHIVVGSFSAGDAAESADSGNGRISFIDDCIISSLSLFIKLVKFIYCLLYSLPQIIRYILLFNRRIYLIMVWNKRPVR